jgi:hypothetical protein
MFLEQRNGRALETRHHCGQLTRLIIVPAPCDIQIRAQKHHGTPAALRVAARQAASQERRTPFKSLAFRNVDQLAAAGENRRTVNRARRILLVGAGGGISYVALFWGRASEDRKAAVASRIGGLQSAANLGDDLRRQGGLVSDDSVGKTPVSDGLMTTRGRTGPLRRKRPQRSKPGLELRVCKPLGVGATVNAN